MTDKEIIDGILDREGPGKPPDYLDKNDKGGRTHWGISENAHPEAWKNGPPSKDMARDIYSVEYITPFDALRNINDDLRIICIDDAVMSGVTVAVKRLQTIVGVTPDGIIGEDTINAVIRQSYTNVVKRYVVARALFLTKLVQKKPSNLKFLTGWIKRTLDFLP